MKSPLLRTGIVIAVLMMAASVFAVVLRPTQKIADASPKIDLEAMIPRKFGEWQEEKLNSSLVVNPQQTELINKLYSQTLSRTYRNEQGYRVMLSIAYGADQRDAIQLHYPEVCYPAQGFQLISNTVGALRTSLGDIPVRRLETSGNRSRFEPVTYWTVVGTHAVVGQFSTKIAKMRYGFSGLIPDGLVFRVSSIEANSPQAFNVHEEFVRSLVVALDAPMLPRLTGLHPASGQER